MSMSSAPTERSLHRIFPRAASGSVAIPLSVRLAKRSVDIASSLIGLFFMALLLPLLALVNYLDGPGPMFYRQRRASVLKGRTSAGRCIFAEFEMLKFRTMRVDAEGRTGAVLAAENDPRVTRVGRVLRKTRLDELPQLWNVLRGDMSLVGPRPERPELLQNLALAIPFFEERMRDCKPGLTGLAQVSLNYSGHAAPGSPVETLDDSLTNPFDFGLARGALADDMRTKLLIDLAYVAALEHFDTFILLELWVIARTPWIMLRGLGR